jgi:hypothetical protein
MTLNDVHEIMGCTGEHLLKQTLDKVDGLPKHVAKQTLKPCPICPAAKGKRLPVIRDPDRPPREYGLHEAVGMDISARQPPSIQGAEYVQLIIEFVSRYVVGQLLKQKSDATEAFREYIVKCFPPDLVQTDGDGAYEGEFDDLCLALGMNHRRSAPYTNAQNTLAETAMRLVFIIARADFIRSGLPIEFWADAVMNAIDTYNCRVTQGVPSGNTPYEEWHGFRPDLSMKRKFGQPCHVLVHSPTGKWASRVLHGYYVRLAFGYKAWKVYIPDQNCYAISRHVTFDEISPPLPKASSEVMDWILEKTYEELVNTDSDLPTSEQLSSSSLTAPDMDALVHPLPPVREAADLSSQPTNTGKQGEWHQWHDFSKQRHEEYKQAGQYTDYQSMRKVIGAEWQNLQRSGTQPPALAPTAPAPVPSSAPVPEPTLAPPPVPTDVPCTSEVIHQANSESEPGEGGVLEPPKLPELPPEIPKIEINPTIPEPEGVFARLRSRGQAHALTTVMGAINTITEAGDTLSRGDFTQDSWDLMCALIEDMPTVPDALNGPHAKQWRKAIQSELQSLLDLMVYKPITRNQVPKGKKVLLSKIVLEYKVYEERFKARLVVLGFMQPDEEVGDTFAPVAKFTTFRILMAVACYYNLDISSSDVKTAFLNAILDDPIYIYPPRGLGFGPNVVWKLLKCLYGLKGSPRGWNITFHSFLIEIGFTQSPIDPCLYYINGLWVLTWVDDTLKVGTTEAIKWFEKECEKRFEINHVDAVEMFVGIEIKRDRANRTMELTQTALIEKMLKKSKLIDEENQPTHGPATPMTENSKVSKADCCKGDKKLIEEMRTLGFDYASAAASALYVSICTRPDIAFAVKEHCKVMSDPGPKHVPSLKRLLKHLRGTKHKGLFFSASDDFVPSFTADYFEVPYDLTLNAYCDASFGDDPDTRRSTQGFVAMLCGAAISWFCQGQKSTSLSTAEAELIALADAIKEVKYIRETMTFLDLKQPGPTIIQEDNMAVVSTAHNPGKNHGKLKHVAIRVRSVQENVLEFQIIDVVHCSTTHMIADILTKALGKEQFTRLAAAILGYAKLE